MNTARAQSEYLESLPEIAAAEAKQADWRNRWQEISRREQATKTATKTADRYMDELVELTLELGLDHLLQTPAAKKKCANT